MLNIMVGYQASGKTTFRKSFFDKSVIVVSKDLMKNRNHKNARQEALIREALAQKLDVVVDNTNCCPKERKVLIDLAIEYQTTSVIYFIDSSFQECVHRNSLREVSTRIPYVGLVAAYKRFRRPSYDEGVNEIYKVKYTSDGVYTVQLEDKD